MHQFPDSTPMLQVITPIYKRTLNAVEKLTAFFGFNEVAKSVTWKCTEPHASSITGVVVLPDEKLVEP